MRLGHRVDRVPETGSTNDDARALAEAGAPHGTVVRADRQLAGRGRAGRAWTSPEGGLWVSVILRPRRDPEAWGLLPLAFGVGAHAALLDLGVEARLKWPNDVLLSGRKVAGILAEGRPGEFAIVGLGLNVNVPESAFPVDVRERATSLEIVTGRALDLEAVFSRLLARLDERYAVFERGGDVLGDYRRALDTLGREIETEVGVGIAVDVREDGALLVERDDGTRFAVTAGDVVVRVTPRYF